jgi:GTPase SAR1 family protein
MGENGLKVLLTGDSGVGKSSVLVRFTDDHFDAECAPVCYMLTICPYFACFQFAFDNRR